MSAVYDNWDRLVRATLRREDLRRTGLRTPSDVSLASSSSFNLNSISPYHKVPSFLLGYSFTYHQILQATNNLSRSNLIFYGKSGDFFYGVLEGGKQVVVKKVDLSSALDMSFLKSEMEFYAKVSHPKFVPLLGHCLEGSNRKFLVYKYMANKDLLTSFYKNTDHSDGPLTPLDWTSRLKVATGIAQALCHLHHECVPPLVHRNVEAGSILIDENYEGHLGRNTEVCTEKKRRNQSRISKLLHLPKGSESGTSDATDATCAYDVYCFGKVLLELVAGFPAFSGSIFRGHKEKTVSYISTYEKELFLKIMDPSLAMEEHLLNQVWKVAVVAKACLHTKPSKRPPMKNVLEVLRNAELEEFSSYVGSASSGQFTQVVSALGKTELPEGSELGTSSSSFANRGIVLWNSQSSPAIGIEDTNQHDEVWGYPEFSFEELRAATKNFSSDVSLGEDACGILYKGFLPIGDRRSLIEIKRWGSEDFCFASFEVWMVQLGMLGRLSHPNLIKLYGYCSEDNELLFVYEYMPKGSLNKLLFGRGSSMEPLSWDIRLKILSGASQGLAFLHASKGGVIFGDFHAGSILLDGSYNAKLMVLPLAGTGSSAGGTPVSTRVMGTNGYAAPESAATGYLNVKTDVYSFGVVMAEVLTGLRALDLNRPKEQHKLVDWIKPRLSDREKVKTIMDSGLQGKYPVQAAMDTAQLALRCLSSQPKLRPSMKQVVETLERIESFQTSHGNR